MADDGITLRAHDDHIEIVGPDSALDPFRPLIVQAQANRDTLPPIAAMRAGAIAFGAGPLARSCVAPVDREAVIVAGQPSAWFRPVRTATSATILYFHGGGYAVGSVDAQAGMAAAVADAMGAPLLAFGYRQAPEHPYPQAIEDAWAAYRWLREAVGGPILLMGDSAGAYLSLATAARAARTDMPAIGAIACSGWFDLEMRAPSWETNRRRDIVSREMGEMFIRHYLGDRASVPAGAMLDDADIALLPPVLIQIGGGEMALDDSFDIAARARRLGRDVTLEVYAGMPHNFVKFAGPMGDAAVARMAAWAARFS